MSRSTRAAALAAYVVALVGWSALVGIPNDPIGIALWLWLFVICWRLDWSWQFPRDWWPWLAALAVYALARGLVDDLGWTPHVLAPIRFDEWIGGGTAPSVRLQDAFYGERVRWYDVAASAVYASHFTVGLVLAGVLWLRDRGLWLQWIRRYVTISYLALVGYVVFPMAPPWMAARDGYLPDLARISSRGFAALGIDRQSMVFGGLPNKTAAMPSLHAGMAFLVVFFAIWKLRSAWRWLLLLYPVAMSATLVYSGEHYVVDCLAGAGIAGLAMALTAWWERRRAPA